MSIQPIAPQVKNPGAYTVRDNDMTLVEKHFSRLCRWRGVSPTAGDASQNVALQDGDTILVARRNSPESESWSYDVMTSTSSVPTT
jgi:hypothetical protein